jgi:hypothetical protein
MSPVQRLFRSIPIASHVSPLQRLLLSLFTPLS